MLDTGPGGGNGRFLGLIVFALVLPWPCTAADCPRGSLTGQVTHVRDGDTIVVGSMPIRLNGLAAPEGDEPGGAATREAMVKLVEGNLRCKLDGERTHDRCVGGCYRDGAHISEVMVHHGVAKDCPRFSQGRYSEAERQAAAIGATIGRDLCPARVLSPALVGNGHRPADRPRRYYPPNRVRSRPRHADSELF